MVALSTAVQAAILLRLQVDLLSGQTSLIVQIIARPLAQYMHLVGSQIEN